MCSRQKRLARYAALACTVPAMPDRPYKHDEPGSAYLRGVGERLRWIRETIGWTQAQCAKAAGVDASTWTKYEAGTRLASVSHMARLAGQVGFSLDFLYRGKIGGVMRRDLELRLVALHPELVLGAEAGHAKEADPVA